MPALCRPRRVSSGSTARRTRAADLCALLRMWLRTRRPRSVRGAGRVSKREPPFQRNDGPHFLDGHRLSSLYRAGDHKRKSAPRESQKAAAISLWKYSGESARGAAPLSLGTTRNGGPWCESDPKIFVRPSQVGRGFSRAIRRLRGFLQEARAGGGTRTASDPPGGCIGRAGGT